MYEYTSIYREMTYGAGIFIFMKKDNTVRVMLGTRNLDIAKIKFGWIANELSKMENRCNRSNGNLAVIDLVIGEGRCFNMGRLIWYRNLGNIESEDKFNEVLRNFGLFANDYMKQAPDIFSVGLSTMEELRQRIQQHINKNIDNALMNSALGDKKEDIDTNSIFVGGLSI